MPRTPIVAGNWKMNTSAQTARELAEAIKAGGLDSITSVEKVLCPPFVYLPLVSDIARGTSVRVGGQDLHWEEKGAFTGEVSGPMLLDFATHVIIGHSERRAYFGETDETVNKKLRAALAHGLTPMVCVGETGAERQANQTLDVLQRQVRGALAGIDLPTTAVIAYEPVWAIGTGVAATSADAQDACAFIRSELAQIANSATADAVRVLYGGSVSPANIAELVSQPDVDGGLVGGAALVAQSFIDMVKNVAAM
ncbi:MAG TPA: triose-phosphate isomerase [Dehalococcoidia bacterium]|nr:triose-phosphate isomerase [Dehalococcoidia bacterium]